MEDDIFLFTNVSQEEYLDGVTRALERVVLPILLEQTEQKELAHNMEIVYMRSFACTDYVCYPLMWVCCCACLCTFDDEMSHFKPDSEGLFFDNGFECLHPTPAQIACTTGSSYRRFFAALEGRVVALNAGYYAGRHVRIEVIESRPDYLKISFAFIW